MKAPEAPAERNWTRSEFRRVADIVHEVAGISFPANRRASAESGMRRVMARLGIAEPVGLEIGVTRGGDVLDALLDDLTIGESYFFREPAQFRFIADEVIPQWSADWPVTREARIWSAGCAAGQEAYSAAIMLRDSGWVRGARILGTDIAEARLKEARAGIYSKWSLRTLPAEAISKWFIQRGTRYHIVPELKTRVSFGTLNLLDPEPRPDTLGQDVIFCRNVLIYFELSAIVQIAERLLDSLAPGGWLFLGASDPHLAELVACEVVLLPGATAYRRNPGSGTTFALRHAPLTLLIPEEVEAAPVAWLPDEEARAPGHLQAPHRPDPDRYAASDPEPGDAEASVSHVRDLANQGRLAEAGEACARALEAHPAEAELHLIDAVLSGEAGRWIDCERAARRAIYLDRTMIAAHLALGDALARLGNKSGARLSFDNAASLLNLADSESDVPGSAGMSAARLLDLVRAHLSMLDSPSPAEAEAGLTAGAGL
ncbi:MAG: CheR family methyltransferase [Gemmatimonadaceae bacterium]